MTRASSRAPRPALAVLALLSVSGTAGAQIAWEADFEAAKQRAAAERKVLFIAINMDGEKANQTLATKTYTEAEVVALSKETVNLIASKYDHRSGANTDARFPTPVPSQR